jgi:UV DNA damage endonuclease
LKIGYPCINLSIGCRNSTSFRLKSYSGEKLVHTVENNLKCLELILSFNVSRNLLFFRLTSDLVPFASHPVNDYDWQAHFRDEFKKTGKFIRDNAIRISMHPDQFIVLNSTREDVFQSSLRELDYHASVLDAMELDNTNKIQIHTGGIYGDKVLSMERFVERYNGLPQKIRDRLVLENDDKLYSFKDCMNIHKRTGIPVLLDTFHHEILNNGEDLLEIFREFSRTWKKRDGIPMLDYSLQYPGGKQGRHAESIDIDRFRGFIEKVKDFDFDIMLEIKDKEASALKASEILKKDPRFIG